MSTEIIEITGKKFVKDDNSPINPAVEPSNIHLNRFWGGLEFNGRAIQVTVGYDYVCLTKKQTRELAYALLDAFDNDIYPSE